MLLAGVVFIVRANTERAVLVARNEEQGRSGRELRKRMDEFNTLFNALPGAAFCKDARGVYVMANSATCERAGMTPEELVGKRDHEVFPKHLADKFVRDDAELLSGARTSLDSEDVFEYPDRTIISATRKVAVVHGDGTIGGIIGLSIDMSDTKRIEEELRQSNALQRVIMELAIGFVNIPLEEMDQGILNALTMVGEFAKVDRSYLFAYDFESRVMNNTHEWCAPGISPEKDNLQGVPTELLPEWVNAHLRNELIHVPDVLAMPADAPLRQILEAQDIRTLITLPLVHGSRCFGFVGFDAVRESKTWTETEISLLKVMAGLLTNAELRRLYEKALHEAKGFAEEAYREIEQRIRERTMELAQANAQLHEEMSERLRALRDLNLIQDAISAILIVVDGQGLVFRWSAAAHKAFGLAAAEAEGLPFMELPIAWDWESVRHGVEHCRETGTVFKAASVRYDRADGSAACLVLTVSPLLAEDQVQSGYLVLGEDITEVKMLEARLSQAAKLEAIGQLAAGIAHEINTPTQFVSDSVTFLQDVFEDMDRVVVSVEGLCAEAEGAQVSALDRVCPILSEIDMDFVRPEVPRTFERIFDGIQRISSIVQAMNRFSHARGVGKKLVNVNEIIENTLVISRNEWKYVADVETDFDPDLSAVYGLADEIGQVFLNIVINAAHAIADKVAGTDGKGHIFISTRKLGDCLETRITDTGAGIPKDVGDKVFNLFFTTKELGKGTGQGLAIAYDIVVNKHGGLITYTSESGIGTTFIVQLPLGGESVCSLQEETNA